MIVSRHILVAVLGLSLVGIPVRVSYDPQTGISVEYQQAFAKSGSGKDGDGGGSDDDDSDDKDDSDDDDDDDDDDDVRNGSRSDDGDDRGSRPIANLHLRYTNGWDERIRNGRYRLVDPQGRTVSDRRATREDLTRMRATASQ